MDDKKLTYIEIGKVGDCVVEFTFYQVGEPLNDDPLPACSIGLCTAFLTNYQKLPTRTKYEGLLRWEPVLKNDVLPTASDKGLIAQFISDLPSRQFIENIKTLDQLYEWMSWKNQCLWIAKCFLAGNQSPDNPLLRPLEEGLISQYTYDIFWLTVDLYENWWKLINLKTRIIKSAFKKQGWGWEFTTARELLESIIASEIDGEFSMRMKPYYVQNASEFRELATLANRSYRGFLTVQEKENMEKLKQKHSVPNIWFKRLIDVSQLLAEKDEFIRVRVAIHQELMRGISKLHRDAGYKPELREQAQISYVWRNGTRIKGIH